MKKLGIKYQILLITLIPVLLVDLFFTYSHIQAGIAKENEISRAKSQIIARQIASASEFSFISGNYAQIQSLLDQSVGSDDILRASIYDIEGTLVAESLSESFVSSEAPDYFYERQPILSQSVGHSDVFSPDSGEARLTSVLGWVNLYVSRERLEITVRQIIIDAILFFVSIFVMALVMTIVISRAITRPIFNLMDHLKQVETGQLGRIIDPVEENEIGAVQKGFNRMTQSLLTNRRHLNQRIQQATRQLNEAITDLESKNRELGFDRDQAQDANRTKSEFLANMSHEIRTPINGIKGFINLLGQSNLDHSQRRYVEIIQKSTEDLTNIVNEILDFTKMESGKLHIFEEPFDLYEVVEQTRDILFINVLTKNIDLYLIIFSDTPRRLIGDKLRLKQILLNLIGNAIKFTDQGRVIVRVSVDDLREDGVDIEISVEDTGIGISQADQQYLFQAFSQVESSDTRRFSGTGLGLAISKNLATLMGGDISMYSRPGEGSRFVLRLPCRFERHDQPACLEDSDASKVLIFGADELALMETRSLYERAGAVVESVEIDNSAGIGPIADTIRYNRANLDLLVFDLRYVTLEPKQLLRPETTSGLRTIVMNYDRGIDLGPDLEEVEFVSVVSTSQSIRCLLAGERPTMTSEQKDNNSQEVAPKHVLLVDDNQVNLTLASELIRLWGHRVSTTDNARQALEMFRRERFDLVVLDIQMPEIDGVSLLGMMREQDPVNRTPIAALTANVLNDEAGRLIELGFDYFLEKPIDEDRFRALVDGEPGHLELKDQATEGGPDSPDCTIDFAGSLALCADNESLLRQIFEIIRRDIPEQRRQLEEALRRDEREKISAIAHKLHGVTCYACLPRLKTCIIEFQQALKSAADKTVESMLGEIDDELEAIEAEIEQYLDSIEIGGKSA